MDVSGECRIEYRRNADAVLVDAYEPVAEPLPPFLSTSIVDSLPWIPDGSRVAGRLVISLESGIAHIQWTPDADSHPL